MSWEEITFLNQEFGEMQSTLESIMMKPDKQEVKSQNLSSFCTKLDCDTTKSIQEVKSNLQSLMDVMKVLNNEHELFINHFQGTSTPSTANIASYHDDINKLAACLSNCENRLSQVPTVLAADKMVCMSELSQLRNLIKAVDSKIPKDSSIHLGGNSISEKVTLKYLWHPPCHQMLSTCFMTPLLFWNLFQAFSLKGRMCLLKCINQQK
jgi:hypothetical protein